MGNISKSFSVLLILILTFSSLLLFATLSFGYAQSGTNESGIITQDTTWTKANSPYTLTGNVLVSQGITLTVEEGVTIVYQGYYNIQVNGTLIAEGTTTSPITFNGTGVQGEGGIITFASVSTSWNDQTNSGSIIKNAVFSSYAGIEIDGASPKISDNTIYGLDINEGGNPEILANNIAGIDIGGNPQGSGGSPTVSNNTIGYIDVFSGSPTISSNTINSVSATGGTPVISNNTISNGVSIEATYGYVSVSNNTITTKASDVISISGNALISDNLITSGQDGIYTVGASASILGNTITHCSAAITGYAASGQLIIQDNSIIDNINGIWSLEADNNNNVVIGNNLISNNSVGIYLDYPLATITNNTIVGNKVGISVVKISATSSPTIQNNNIYANSEYNIKWGAPNNVNAVYNWWGTTDQQAINQTIYDSKDDFNLGTVNFVPFLTAPNPQAMPDLNVPIPTPTPTQTSSTSASSTPTVPEFPSLPILSMLMAISTIVFFTIATRKRHTSISTKSQTTCFFVPCPL